MEYDFTATCFDNRLEKAMNDYLQFDKETLAKMLAWRDICVPNYDNGYYNSGLCNATNWNECRNYHRDCMNCHLINPLYNNNDVNANVYY